MVTMYAVAIELSTEPGSITDITSKIKKIVEDSKINNGLCNIFIPGTTAGIMMNENERMLMEDFKKYFAIFNEKGHYNHPDNAFSHLRANLLDTEKTIPIMIAKAAVKMSTTMSA